MKLTPRVRKMVGANFGRGPGFSSDQLLLAVLRDESSVGATVLRELGTDIKQISDRLAAAIEEGGASGASQRHVLEHATGYARMLSHTYTGSAHILLAILDDPTALGPRFLREAGVTRDSAFAATVQLFSPRAA